MKEPKNEITTMVDEGNMNIACDLECKAFRFCLEGEWDKAVETYKEMLKYYGMAGYPVDKRTADEVLDGMMKHDMSRVDVDLEAAAA